MEFYGMVVLTHRPRCHNAEGGLGARRQPDQPGIPSASLRVASGHPICELGHCVLRLVGNGCVRKIGAHVLIGELAPKPGLIPEKKRDDDEQYGYQGDRKVSPGWR